MYNNYFAQAYGTSTYGGGTYQCTGTSCQTQTVTVPNTGVLYQPTFMVPAILGGAVIIAIVILIVKKIIRKKVQN